MDVLKMTILSFALVSFNTNAAFIRNVNGVDYEWMQLPETLFMSRNQVEPLLSDPASILFGYQYASRALTAGLFLSYISWDGSSGTYGNPVVVQGLSMMMYDLGATEVFPGNPDYNSTETITSDGYIVQYSNSLHASFLYGGNNECGNINETCEGHFSINTDINDLATMATVSQSNGIDATATIYPVPNDHLDYMGSLLYRPVPLPASVWLFASGLIGLTGIARRKK